MNTQAAHKRLLRDFKKIQEQTKNEKNAGLSAAPIDKNILEWEAVIFGPEDTPWEQGIFRLHL